MLSMNPLALFQEGYGWRPCLEYADVGPMFAAGEGLQSPNAVILVAEDDENDVFLIKRALHQAQFENPLQVVANGEEAIAYLRGDPPFEDREKHPTPALILLDLKMPRKNGFEVLAWIRQRPELNALAVVVLTSSQESADINQAYALGANSYLVKPANFLSLVDMINRLKEFCKFTSQSVGTNWV
jgi:CheY-like chemotaxis protein